MYVDDDKFLALKNKVDYVNFVLEKYIRGSEVRGEGEYTYNYVLSPIERAEVIMEVKEEFGQLKEMIKEIKE